MDVRKDPVDARIQADVGGGDVVTFTVTEDVANHGRRLSAVRPRPP